MREIRPWLDNPILVKHVRSRLRQPQLVPPVTVLVVCELLLVWYGVSNNAFADRRVFLINVAIQGVILIILGAAQVGATLASARESVILDFHRISPLSPWTITLGFFLG